MGSIGSGSVSTIPSPNSSPSSFTTAPSNPNETPHGTLSMASNNNNNNNNNLSNK
jgi:hypothetical protein